MKRIFSRWHVALWLVVALLTASTAQTGILNHFLPTPNHTNMQEDDAVVDSKTSQSNIANQSVSIHSSAYLNNTTSHYPLEDQMKSRRQCTPGPNQPMERVHLFPNYANASSFWTYPSSNKEVVCEFNKDRQSAMHFPHAMQQLYGCFSLWQEYLDNRPVLLLSAQVEKKLKRNQFLKGILQIFQSQLKVDVLAKKAYLEQTRDNGELPTLQTLDVKGGYILQYAKKLNDLATKEFQLEENDAHRCVRNKPRIGIVNRRVSAGRSIVNAELLAATSSITNFSHNNSVLVEYFEGLDFLEQITFFRSIDMLIASHGAQLTGLAFMNAPCSHVVELFPKGYAIPDFYGSLAINSGKQYSYVYMSENSFHNEQATSFSDRLQARSINLCPSPDMIASMLVDLLDGWKKCCEKLSPSD